jgi:hypothetical protein
MLGDLATLGDRMGATASWWHCDEHHHGMAIVPAPRGALSHHAFTVEDLNAVGRVADPPQAARDDRALFRYRPDTRLPAAHVAGRTETDQPVGRVAARALHPHRVPAGEAGRRPAAVRDAAGPNARRVGQA